MTRRQGRRRKKLLDDFKDRRGYSQLKEEALDRTLWRNHFRGGFVPVVRQNIEWMNINSIFQSRHFSEHSHACVRTSALLCRTHIFQVHFL